VRKLKRLAALVAVAGTALLLAAPSALAGGPTSAILVAPNTGHTAALYNSNSDYTTLSAALGENPAETEQGSPLLQGGPGSSAINITWLMHDVQVWRVDHVFLTEPGGPWVETYQSFDGDIKFDQRGVVHKAADPGQLTRLLYSLLDAGTTRPAPVPVSAPISVPAAVEATGLHWGSLLVGLAIGVVVVVAARQLRSGRKPA
jgi:hypothetical protein